ncbi:MAG: lamin tail domain-containing protein [Kiritimatiellae bacterium]|nr:lamin tail domain-containing protein [Kiritimatiellia bacterium]
MKFRGSSLGRFPAFVVLATLAVHAQVRAATLVPKASTWRYHKGTAEASDPRSAWRAVDFDDSAWAKGQAPVGYGLSGLNTTLGDMQGSYSSVFLRKTFTVTSLAFDTRLRAAVDWDDGFILWINGEPVLDKDEPDGTPLHTSLAAGYRQGGLYEAYELPEPEGYLELGENVIAVQLFNNSLASSDAKIDVELSTFQQVADTKFSHDRGFYEAPFWVTIITETPGATIRYTTDGSWPTATHGATAVGSAKLQIGTSRCVRAAAFKGGYEPTDIDTHTYVFLDAVLTQPAHPAGFPSYWESTYPTNGAPTWYKQKIEAQYEMNPSIVSAYGGRIRSDLQALPSLCVSMPVFDWWDVETGCYYNCMFEQDRDLYERKASLELIYPDGRDGFSVPCGVRPHSHIGNKRMFKLKFRKEYGTGKLRFPIFRDAAQNADSAVDEFDCLVLRGRWWSHMRDEWYRNSTIDVSGFGAHGDYVHVYINGLYWGVYDLTERPDDHWQAAYFGGEPEDYFAAHHGNNWETPKWAHTQVGAGDPTRWNYLHNTLVPAGGFGNAATYEKVKQYLDVEEYSEFLTIGLFGNQSDWPYQNWYGGHRNVPAPEPAKYFSWDGDYCWKLDKPVWSDWGWQLNGDHEMGNLWKAMNPSRDFRMTFADVVYQQCYHGALTEDASRARWDALYARLEPAIIAEAARWQPTQTDIDAWYNDRAGERALMAGRRDRLIAMLRTSEGGRQILYPSLDPPTFNQHGGAVVAGFKLTLSKTAGSAIYYTLDGTDPRLAGGAKSGSALTYGTPVTLSKTTHVKARVYKTNSTWSAVHAATYNYTAHYSKIRITEILYNPLGGDRYEFLEIRNTGTSTRGLSEMRVRGVNYSFPAGAELAPDQCIVLAADAAAFQARYGFAPFAEFGGRLDNSGERIALLDSDGRTVTSVRYNDNAPWPTAADGDGFSLVPIETDGDQDDAAKWRASNLIGGSPGYEDGAPSRVVISEALTHTDLPAVDAIELHNGGDAQVGIGGWYLSDTVMDYKKYRIPDNTVIAAGGYAVLYETALPFALDSHGDEIYLTKWDANGNLQYLAEERFGGAANGVAFARHVCSDGGVDFVAQSTANTLGTANAYPKVGPVVINEIMYNPAGRPDLPAGADAVCEFVELHNISAGAVPLYDPANPANGWQLDGAVAYTFPPNTTLGAGEFVLVVPTNDAAFRAACPAVPAGVRVFGPYARRLDNGGESVKLWRPDTPDPEGVPRILVDRVNYNDNSPWPERPDGDGPSLERIAPGLYGNDPANWAASLNAGGTPGAANSGALVSKTAGWRYQDRGQDLGTGWRAIEFDDGAWADGNAPLGYPETSPELDTLVDFGDNPANKPITTYFRTRFAFGAAPATVTGLTLAARYDDGFVAYLNGQEIVRKGMPAGTIAWSTPASSSNGSQGNYEPIDLTAHAGKLRQGINVLAVELHQVSADSSDVFLDMELSHTVTAGAITGEFTAYNDLAWAEGQPAVNVSLLTRGQAGLLVDHATGRPISVQLAVSAGGGGPYPTQGANAAAGTDADALFGGIVDCTGLISYGTDDLVLSLTGLDPTYRYMLALFGNRASASYTARTTIVRLEGAESFANTSSAGATVETSAAPDDTTVIANGSNTGEGLVARYANIACGSDGAIALRIPAWSGTGDAGRYYVNALMLAAIERQIPQSKIAKGSTWRYRKGTAEASSPAAHWRDLRFNDADWATGSAPFGYGSLTYATHLDMSRNYASVFLRRTFTLDNPARVSEIQLAVDYDDGFIAWINGREVARVNVQGEPGTFVPCDATCSGCVGDGTAAWSVSLTGSELPALAERNVLAVQLFNNSLASSDAMFDAALSVVEYALSAAQDADGDALPDAWENAFLSGLSDPSDLSDSGDPDGDGLSNLEEYIAGTDPQDEAGWFAVDLRTQSGAVTVSFATVPAQGAGYEGLARHYTLERGRLDTDEWHVVPGFEDIVGNGQTVTYTATADGETRAYRARVWLQ